MVKAFVYGILKSKGRAFHSSQCTDVKKATIKGYMMLSIGSFPACVYTGEDKDVVHGEVHTYPDDIFTESFDRIEGYDEDTHSGMYLREPIQALTDEGLVDAQMYVWNSRSSSYPIVESGEWEV